MVAQRVEPEAWKGLLPGMLPSRWMRRILPLSRSTAGVAIVVSRRTRLQILAAVTDRHVQQPLLVELKITGVVVATRRRDVIDEYLLVAEIPAAVDAKARNTVAAIGGIAAFTTLAISVVEVHKLIAGLERRVDRQSGEKHLATRTGIGREIEYRLRGARTIPAVHNAFLSGNQQLARGQPINGGG